MGRLTEAAENPNGFVHELRSLADKALLRNRVRRLEEEIQECRQLNLRLAELIDVVTELLVPVAERDEARIHEVLERYRKSL